MVTAIVLMNTERGEVARVARAIGQVPEATEVHSVTGPYDLVVKVQVEEYELMAEVITEKLGQIEGVLDTETLMAFRTYKF